MLKGLRNWASSLVSSLNTTGSFFFIHHPEYGSFALIHVRGRHHRLPNEFRELMPGSVCGGVRVERDRKWLALLKKNRPEWFDGLDEREERELGGVPYRLVMSSLSV